MATTRRTANDILAFLDVQKLEPTPRNYTLGYHFITGANKMVKKEVQVLTDGGVRMTQHEVDTILETYGIAGTNTSGSGNSGASGNEGPAPDDGGTDAFRHQAIRLSDIADEQTRTTSQFGQDLADGMAKLANGDDVAKIVSQMIERTNNAERDLAAAAAETKRLREDLEAARADATIDALTGLANRRSADELLADIQRRGVARSIAFCDIDRFKRINDTYGHAVGDRIIKGVAEILKETCSEQGTVTRYGGEEFVVVFENCDLAKAASIMEVARVRLTRKHFKLRETDEPLGMVSFSAGVAEGSGDTSSLTAAADALLYKAKQEGRNQVLTS